MEESHSVQELSGDGERDPWADVGPVQAFGVAGIIEERHPVPQRRWGLRCQLQNRSTGVICSEWCQRAGATLAMRLFQHNGLGGRA